MERQRNTPTYPQAPKRPRDDRDDRDESEPSSNTHRVAQHYNERPDVGIEKRKESKIIRLRSFNNWVKSVLITSYVLPKANAFDMGCGKGGDLIKWSKARIGHLVAADVASVSLEQMKSRYQALQRRTFSAEFYTMDCYQESIATHLKPDFMFDVVSMQFCLHYAFESEQKARKMLENVSSRLRSGGWFFGTMPDANWIVKRLRHEPEGSVGFGNSIYRIEFDHLQGKHEKKAGFTRYGCKYMFHLVDAVDCPEYLVHWTTFERLAKEYGLVLRRKDNFHNFYTSASKKDEFDSLLRVIGVIGGARPEMSAEEWEAAGIYMAFVFQKN
ncbi:guanine-N(7)-methyltransferase domain-containing protein [Spinellus fusiger]|nr:guanine-N(7)-methyltransferase domain-containing protein [Spinellus fusiger]